MLVNPTIEDFKSYFFRDFPYGENVSENVLDSDIEKAMDIVICQINTALFCSQQEYTTGYLNLAAHYLCLNIQASSQGLYGRFEWASASKSVGSVSVSQSIPETVSKNPVLSWLTTTNYGINYLMIILPRLSGSMFIAAGRTNP